MQNIYIYTDGACSGNPGPGGYAAVIVNDSGIEASTTGHEQLTTNNRMELMAVIAGMSYYLKCSNKVETDVVTILSDSQYVVSAFNNNWIKNWQKNNWMTSSKTPVKNVDLWKQLIELVDYKHVTFKKVKGHSGNKYNDLCDQLAVDESLSVV